MITAPVYTLQQVQNGYLEITSCALQPERAVSSSQRAGTNKRLVAKSCNLPEYVLACLPYFHLTKCTVGKGRAGC